jgi:hypothetical protein
LTVSWPSEPYSVTARFDKKGKLTKISSRIVRTERTRSGYIVHLALELGKHRQTLIRLN